MGGSTGGTGGTDTPGGGHGTGTCDGTGGQRGSGTRDRGQGTAPGGTEAPGHVTRDTGQHRGGGLGGARGDGRSSAPAVPLRARPVPVPVPTPPGARSRPAGPRLGAVPVRPRGTVAGRLLPTPCRGDSRGGLRGERGRPRVPHRAAPHRAAPCRAVPRVPPLPSAPRVPRAPPARAPCPWPPSVTFQPRGVSCAAVPGRPPAGRVPAPPAPRPRPAPSPGAAPPGGWRHRRCRTGHRALRAATAAGTGTATATAGGCRGGVGVRARCARVCGDSCTGVHACPCALRALRGRGRRQQLWR